MIVVKLIRLETSDAGTFGTIDCKGVSFVSGELPWRNNEKEKSCVPEGSYEAVWCFSPRFQRYTYLLKAVPGRDAIRIHAASFMGDRSLSLRSHLDGCIAIGDGVKFMDRQQFLVNSASSTRTFDNRMGGESFTLEISARLPLAFRQH